VKNLHIASLSQANSDLSQKFLKINNRGLADIPPSIDNHETLSYLTILDLSSNLLCEIPKNIAFCIRLESADLSKNQIKKLGLVFDSLHHLRHLNVAKNCLRYVTEEEISSLRGLKTLILSQNRLTQLPSNFAMMESLETLCID
jgi:Leucine-rich repeat (LRR) protein